MHNHDRPRARREGRLDSFPRFRLKVDVSTSTRTGLAPLWTTTFAVAGNVKSGTMTSSPGPMPNPSRVR